MAFQNDTPSPNQMASLLQVVKPRSAQQKCSPDFDEREMLCYLYDDMGAWKLSNRSSLCTNDAEINNGAGAQAFQSAFPGLSSAIARANAAWDKSASGLSSAANGSPESNPLPDFTLPMSRASCVGYSESTRSAAISADEEDQSMCKLAGLPRLHASSFEILCINGLCTVAHTDTAWTCVREHIYVQAARFLMGYSTAWLMQAAHPSQHSPCDILQLEAHVRLIGKLHSFRCCIIAISLISKPTCQSVSLVRICVFAAKRAICCAPGISAYY